jgi:hypothetical protein
MAISNRVTNRLLRMDAKELKRRMDSGEPVTILDVRGPQAWDSADIKIRGAVRTPPDALPADPPWPKDRLTVAYFT